MTGRSRALVVILSLIVLATVVAVGWRATSGRDPHPAHAEEAVQYVCPMHPQIVQDRPGKCPICGMDLVPAAGEPEPATPEERASPGGPEGLARVRLTEAKARRIGARSVPAEVLPFEREIRAVGNVAVDETRLRQVHTKTAGWVERLWADAVGDPVRKGRPLLEIYSPELLAAQEEFLVAVRARASLRQSASEEVAGSGDALLEAARSRLRLLDLTGEEIAALEAGGKAKRTVVLPSPISGTILKRGVAQGARVEPGTMLLEVADLSRVWVLASVYEYELAFVREGQEAAMTLPYVPGREFRGRVAKVYPTLDPATRTAQVRVEFANPGGELRPDMYAEVRLAADLGERLAVPTETVMETGTRSVVFVDEGEGVFVPREIRVGLRLPGRVEVLSGLVAGERVLAQGNFFVDSESKLRAALEAQSGR
jgi:Cu(I)/Ag(I) efflux system membrane fusion protein